MHSTDKTYGTFWKYDPQIISLEDCKECDNFVEIDKVHKHVICNRTKTHNATVHIMPSCWNDGFKNGKMVVRCKIK
jgi:hypothetical protein